MIAYGRVRCAITRRVLSVAPTAGQGKIYGAANPVLAYTHGTLYNGDTDAGSEERRVGKEGENIGNYAISKETLSAGSNYTILFTTVVTFAISKRDMEVSPQE